MTAADLIAALQTWPGYADVLVCRDVGEKGCANLYSIHHVSGAAGGAIDGRDSCVTIEITARASEVK